MESMQTSRDDQSVSNSPTIEVRDLVVEYRTDAGVVKALNGLDLTIGKGETLGLVGETGAGKTTAGLSILGLIPDPPGIITRGTILLDGEDLMTKSEKEMDQIRGSRMAMIFQDPMTALNPVMRVEAQIAEGIEMHRKVPRAEAVRLAREMLALVGIPPERGSDYPHQFSGGMKQRVVIAISLSSHPEFIIADEPTTALDVTIQAQVLEMIKDLRDRNGTSMLMITHNLGIVVEICDKVSVIYAGRVVEHGTVEAVYEHTAHPYTKGLFDSLPNLDDRKAKLKPIKGLMPDPVNLPAGCAFFPRCDYAMESCENELPSRVFISDEHYVECHLYDKGCPGGERTLGR